MSVNLSPVAGAAAQFLDNSGNVLTGGKLYTYAAGTTTPQATYTSGSGVTFHSNPIILDAAGRVPAGGEIWLTDGLQYKFVLKDANDVLIGTWDNIIGINSNFLNFYTQEETQTATQSQTIFTLATVTYSPGTNTLSVYINGSKQIVDINYYETDSTTVTFVSGLNVGDVVDFTTAVTLSSGVTNASLVVYDPPFTGATPTTVELKLAQTVSVKDFGAVGDGVTDDTAAFANALAASNSVFVPAGTYLLNSLTLSASSGQTLTGASRNSAILKASSSATKFLSLGSGSGYSIGNSLSNFSIDFSLAPASSASQAIYMTNTYNNSFSNIEITNIATSQIALNIYNGSYTTTFTSVDFGSTTGIIESTGTIADQPTTMTFTGCAFAQANLSYFLSYTFIQPIIQGALTPKINVSENYALTIIGGDIEHTGSGATYLYFGTNAQHINSTGNEFSNIDTIYSTIPTGKSIVLMDNSGLGYSFLPPNNAFGITANPVVTGALSATGSILSNTYFVLGPSFSATWQFGSGPPNGVVSAPVGSIYSNTTGGANTSFYVKESGANGNTGWVGK